MERTDKMYIINTRDDDDPVSIEEEPPTLTPTEKVFGIDLLLNKILKFAIFDDDGKLHKQTINSCKLVQRQWLESLSFTLQKFPPSWYPVALNIFRDGKDLDKFVDTFANSPANRIPPYVLTIRTTDAKIGIAIAKCLTHCGSGLQELKLFVRDNIMEEEEKYGKGPHLFPVVTTPLYLPHLNSLVVNMECAYNPSSEILYKNVSHLIDSILAGCQDLQSVTMFMMQENSQLLSTVFSKNFHLPDTVAKVDFHFDCEMILGLVSQPLLRKPLPHLTDLTLGFRYTQFGIANELKSVLNTFRHQLQKLNILVLRSESTSDSQIGVVLPLMEKLEVLDCLAKNFEWPAPASSDGVPNLKGYFPALKKVAFWQDIKLCKWPQGVQLRAVNEAKFMWGTDTLDEIHGDAELLQQLEGLKHILPNVTKLDVRLPFTSQMSHVKFIFREMRQLEELNLVLFESYKRIRTRPFEPCLFGDGDDDYQNYSLLLHMTELRKLQLGCEYSRMVRQTDYFLNDTIMLTFLKMPQLEYLRLEGRIKVSPQMFRLWTELSRCRCGLE